MPWHTGVNGAAPVLPVNAVSGKPYRGVNTVVLWATAQAEGYPSAVWMRGDKDGLSVNLDELSPGSAGGRA